MSAEVTTHEAAGLNMVTLAPDDSLHPLMMTWHARCIRSVALNENATTRGGKMKHRNEVVQQLVKMINDNDWVEIFEEGIRAARESGVKGIEKIKGLEEYLEWINDFLYWIPAENSPGSEVYNRLAEFYFILDQSPIVELQDPVLPSARMPATRPLSKWMVEYAKAMGAFLDTPESLTKDSIDSFYNSPAYNMGDYVRPRGDWKNFNQFFARYTKPGLRPVAALGDSRIIVSPADSTFAGQWEIRTDSQITVKNLHWSVRELMDGSPYQDRFINGIFMHSFLKPNDYHRQHTPVAGRVLEARVIPGHVFLEVRAVLARDDGSSNRRVEGVRSLDSLDEAGYQFSQARGLVVLESAIGLVAVLPIGMAQVSSVVMTAEVGVSLRKGEEISYFPFGGSEIIVMFEASSNVCFTAQPGVNYKQGTKIAEAYPVL